MFSFHDKWRAWVVVALLFLFMVINYADKAVIGLVAVSVMHEAFEPSVLRQRVTPQIWVHRTR